MAPRLGWFARIFAAVVGIFLAGGAVIAGSDGAWMAVASMGALSAAAFLAAWTASDPINTDGVHRSFRRTSLAAELEASGLVTQPMTAHSDTDPGRDADRDHSA